LQLGLIARQFQLTTDQIQDLVDTAVDQAIQERQPLQNQHLFAAARAHSTVRLTSLATKITPRYAWSDLILPDTQMNMLREMTSTIKYRSLVLEDWGVGQKLVPSTGITTLFVGPPGTGKTMAAEVIAADLGLDLYKIDLSGVVSKYIGETEKNLERIFTEADRSNAILFFDEADAIFGKRSDVKDARDRYANIEISYLLQRMESYNGVTILATNLGTNLDDAFTRRLQFRITFSDPEIEQRMQIWQTLFPPGVPRASDVDWAWLAHKFNLTGGNIRNIIVAAAYLAAEDGRTVTMSQILHATRRELQKMGRMINERDFVRG
jgi:SpoVK/Ycf46/Vps4 family AAA+-type ATPase